MLSTDASCLRPTWARGGVRCCSSCSLCFCKRRLPVCSPPPRFPPQPNSLCCGASHAQRLRRAGHGHLWGLAWFALEGHERGALLRRDRRQHVEATERGGAAAGRPAGPLAPVHAGDTGGGNARAPGVQVREGLPPPRRVLTPSRSPRTHPPLCGGPSLPHTPSVSSQTHTPHTPPSTAPTAPALAEGGGKPSHCLSILVDPFMHSSIHSI